MGKFTGYVIKLTEYLFLVDYENYLKDIEGVQVSFRLDEAFVFSDLAECRHIVSRCGGSIYKRTESVTITIESLEVDYDDIT